MTGVVIPTYNEAENIPALFEGLAPLDAQIIVVDDGSKDGTPELAEKAGARVIRRGRKMGLASAYVHGMTEALSLGLDPIVQMDADLSHQPSDVARLLPALEEADLVLGSRWVEGGGIENWDATRLWLSRFGSRYSRLLLDLPYRDLTGGFKAWRAPLLARIDLQSIRSEGYAFQVETTFRAHRRGARIREVPIIFADRFAGQSKMSWNIALEAAFVVPMLRWRGQ